MTYSQRLAQINAAHKAQPLTAEEIARSNEEIRLDKLAEQRAEEADYFASENE